MGNMHRITRHVPAGLCRGRYAIYIRSCNAFQGKESKKSLQMEVFPLCVFGVPIMRIVVCCVLDCGHPIYGNCQIYSPQKEQQKKQAQLIGGDKHCGAASLAVVKIRPCPPNEAWSYEVWQAFGLLFRISIVSCQL